MPKSLSLPSLITALVCLILSFFALGLVLVSFVENSPGPTGPTGPASAQAAVGPAGPTGPRGPKGQAQAQTSTGQFIRGNNFSEVSNDITLGTNTDYNLAASVYNFNSSNSGNTFTFNNVVSNPSSSTPPNINSNQVAGGDTFLVSRNFGNSGNTQLESNDFVPSFFVPEIVGFDTTAGETIDKGSNRPAWWAFVFQGWSFGGNNPDNKLNLAFLQSENYP